MKILFTPQTNQQNDLLASITTTQYNPMAVGRY